MKKRNWNTEQKIINTALKVFAKKGYFKTTVEDIAKAAGFAKGTLYLYFKNKESLYIAMLDAHIGKALTMIEGIEHSERSATDKLSDILTTMVNYMKTLKGSYPILSFDDMCFKGNILKKIGTTIMPKINELIVAISHIIKQGIDDGEFIKMEPIIAGFYFFNVMRTAIFSNFLKADILIDADSVLRLFFDGINKRR